MDNSRGGCVIRIVARSDWSSKSHGEFEYFPNAEIIS